MRSAELRERITMLPPMSQVDEFGTSTVYPDPASDVGFLRTWATVTPIKQSENSDAGTVRAATRYKIWMRHRKGLSSAFLIAWRGHLLHIDGITETQDRTGLGIDAIEHEGPPPVFVPVTDRTKNMILGNFGILFG